MPQISVNSSNIGNFGWSASFDILNRSVLFNLLPFTTGAGLSNTKVSWSVIDQDGVILASIDWTNPQIPNPGTTTSWVLDLSSVNYPFLFQTYQIIGSIQDQGGTIYSTPAVYPNVCQPSNLTDQGFVPGLFQIIPDCINSVLTVKEITALVYNSLTPTLVTKSGNLYYPTGTISSLSFANTPFSNNVIYSGQYRVQCTTVATYSIGQDVYVLVSYETNNVFDVTCANKMADMLCCIQKVQQTAIKNCNNAIGENAKHQLSDISLYVMNGLLKEISGQDAQFEVDYIKKYLSCDCGSASLSQSEFTPINPAVNSIVLNGVGGTSIPSPTITGNTKTYNIASNVYQVVKGNTGDLAFTISLNTAIANTVQYIITFNYDTMAGYILTAIQNDPALLSQLNSLISSSSSILGLNGSCVINTTQTSYSLSQPYTNSTLIVSITINGIIHAAPANLFANNPSSVQAWLTSLVLGTFTASVGGGIITILSPNNTNTVSTMTFSSPNVTVMFQATNVTLVQVLQAIINYLCNLTDLQIALANNLTLCTLDYANAVVLTSYAVGTKQSAYNSAVSNAICNLAGRISSLTALTCAKLQAIFSDNPNGNFNYTNDRFLSIMGGGCTTMTSKQAALAVINAINSDATTKAAYCAINCNIPATCPDISGINMSIVGSNIGIYGVTFNNAPIANQIVTVSYRVHGTVGWTVSTSGLSISPNGNVSGTSPYLIPGPLMPTTTYDVWINNNCGGVGFIGQVTTPSGTVYSDSFRYDTVIGNVCTDTPHTLYSNAPFATGVTMYTDPGASTSPLTGFSYITNGAGIIFNINSSTGVVGASTGSNCASGTAGTYILGNNPATICSGSPVTLYTSGAFAIGGILYTDSALTTPVTGSSYVVQNSTNHIFNLNSGTGVIGADTGSLCSGTATLTFSFTNAGGSFLNFQASLNHVIDAPININKVFADGFNNGACSGGAVSSAQKNATMVINAGSAGVGASPDVVSGSWAAATNYSMYNLIVNGVPHVNGDTVVIGSFTVTISLPACN